MHRELYRRITGGKSFARQPPWPQAKMRRKETFNKLYVLSFPNRDPFGAVHRT